MLSNAIPDKLLDRLNTALCAIFGVHLKHVILFGSYARGDAAEGSDVDVMALVDLSREEIIPYRRQIAAVAGELLLSEGVLVSVVAENQDFFDQKKSISPFYRNIVEEGVPVGA